MTDISLHELLDLSIGTPDVGSVNFSALHALLNAILGHLKIETITTAWKDADHEHGGPPQTKALPVDKSVPYKVMEEKVRRMEEQMSVLESLPSASQLIKSDSAVNDMWTLMQLRRKAQGNEDGVSKCMALIQDLLTEIQALKESRDDLTQKIQTLDGQISQLNMNELADRILAVEQYCHQVDDLNNTTKELKDKLTQYPLPEELTQCVTWEVMQAALISETQKIQEGLTNTTAVPSAKDTVPIHPLNQGTPFKSDTADAGSDSSPRVSPPRQSVSGGDSFTVAGRRLSRVSSGAEQYPETVEALIEVGGLRDRHESLEARVGQLEANKADRTELQHLNDLLAAMGERQIPDYVPEQLDHLRTLVDSLIADKDKVSDLDSVLLNIAGGSTGLVSSQQTDASQIEQMTLHISHIRGAVLKLEGKVQKFIREMQDRMEERNSKDRQMQEQLNSFRSVLEDVMSYSSTPISDSQQQMEEMEFSKDKGQNLISGQIRRKRSNENESLCQDENSGQGQRLGQAQNKDLFQAQNFVPVQGQSSGRIRDQGKSLGQAQSKDLGQAQDQSWGQSSGRIRDQGESLSQAQSKDLGQVQEQSWGQSSGQIRDQGESLSQAQSKDLGQAQDQSWGQSSGQIRDQGESLSQAQSKDLGQAKDRSLGQSSGQIRDQGESLIRAQSKDLGQAQDQSWAQNLGQIRDQGKSLSQTQSRDLFHDRNVSQAQGQSLGQILDQGKSVSQAQSKDLGQAQGQSLAQNLGQILDQGKSLSQTQSRDLFHDRNVSLAQGQSLGQIRDQGKSVSQTQSRDLFQDQNLGQAPRQDLGQVQGQSLKRTQGMGFGQGKDSDQVQGQGKDLLQGQGSVQVQHQTGHQNLEKEFSQFQWYKKLEGKTTHPLNQDHDRSKNNELVSDVQGAILQLQAEYEKLNSTTNHLMEEHSKKQIHIDRLYKAMEKLDEKKADKELVEMEIDIKADKRALESKVSRMQFDSMTEQLNNMLQEVLSKISGQEQDWHKIIEKISTEMDCKLNRIELEPLKKQLDDRWKSIHRQLQIPPAPGQDDAAGIRKQLLARFHCISCDRPVDMITPGQHFATLPCAPGLPPHKSNRPYTVYELEQVRQQCRRQIEQESHFSTSRPPKCHYRWAPPELSRPKMSRQDRSKLERIPEMADYSYLARNCGGSHTLTYPHNRRYTRLQHITHVIQTEEESRPVPSAPYTQPEEVDILGLDGQVYKGRMNGRAVKVSESRLPTISPREGNYKSKDKINRSQSQRSCGVNSGRGSPARPQSAKTHQIRSASSSSMRDRPMSSMGCLSQGIELQSSVHDTTTELHKDHNQSEEEPVTSL
ncbi:uncharacterized protein [Misgurnus anguillicaudatus]|uniref:uncharacterized protein isoform X1 n=1 Tax=Misgurnus anguillicaudatus TaxID=75329 RepID=UPI003CCFCE28